MPSRLLERALRRPFVPFLVFAVVAQLYLAWPVGELVRPGWAVVAVALFLLTCALAIVTRRPGWSNVAILAPLLYLVVLALWRHADGSAVAGFEIIALLPVAWTALFGTMRQVVITIVAMAATLVLPIWTIGLPEYPTSGMRSAVLITIFAMFIAPTAQYLVIELDRESARLDAVLRAATGHSVVACDLDGTITVFNPGAERLLGWSAAEAVGARMTDLLHDPHEVVLRAAELGIPAGVGVLTHAVTAAGGMETRDWSYFTRGGARLTVSLAMTGIRNSDGQLVGYMGVATDVTEARRTLLSLEGQREMYRLLIDHLPGTTVGVLDEQLRCVTIGGHWMQHAPMSAEHMVGTHVGDFFTDEDRAAGVAIYQAGMDGQTIGELRLSTGQDYQVEVVPLRGPEGQRWVLSVARDVSAARREAAEREHIAAALAASEASFREAFDGAPIGIAVTSVVAGREDRFLRVNSAFADLLGRAPEDLAGVPVLDLTYHEDVAMQPDLSPDAVSPMRLRKRFVHASGRPIWVDITLAVVRDAHGNPSHVIKHAQDIRAIKESERALLEALEQQRAATAGLRELDRIRREVVGTVSHELRTPLTSIHGYLELLAEEDNITRAQHQMIDVAMRNSLRLAGLVDNLLVLAKIESDDTTVAPFNAHVIVQDAVHAALETVRPEISDRGQRLITRLAGDLATVQGDAEQLHRALINLLTNASKYTPNGGAIEVDLSVAAGTVRIVIADSGIGIPRDEQPHLFERFFRASTARDQAIGGNGLGLAIVKSIVELHDGQITVDSEPGRGSAFCLELPLASGVPAAPVAPAVPVVPAVPAEAVSQAS